MEKAKIYFARRKLSGVVNDQTMKYIVRLIKQVITISLETVQIVKNLPDLGLPKDQLFLCDLIKQLLQTTDYNILGIQVDISVNIFLKKGETN